MIKAIIYRLPDTSIQGFELSGHADSGPHGHDLVCAAVSAVTFGMTNAVMKHSGIEPIIDQGADGGYLKVILPDNSDQEARRAAQLLFEGMLTTLETIAHDYGQYITIFEKQGG
ncbi:hypothetical protein GCM10012290_09470 [Halolactibacillus alkaliphilus]|uniref:Ribosomal processing cysteine protease Prp n=1 Tax=Halolactibacillus alkaliphilus TaxID=442899 RepID=A0A511WY23_9BACI|nr:ribosomal-processing cysteine protease Prp [Halolactibacillus alkaliphilus]GEN56009.1 hypothetical protein HAL01_04730 [Halolactibacillus alkaliphilus]GGN68148.1 hypothetical protein GCM10012290_09470 [Halolactibacillus alkaliphilus]SFO69673.1 hypothetical protein SAMN05720591_10561 [Halolactibacillus alkaliphilus]